MLNGLHEIGNIKAYLASETFKLKSLLLLIRGLLLNPHVFNYINIAG